MTNRWGPAPVTHQRTTTMLKAIDLVRANPLEPIYTFIDPHSGKNTNIASRKLHDWCVDNISDLEIVLIKTEATQVKKFLSDNSISAAHCGKLLADYLLRTLQFEPIIFCAEGPRFAIPVADGGDLAMLVDGHHRYAVVHIAGIQKFNLFPDHDYPPCHVPSIILQPHQWTPFEIEGCEEINSEQLRDIPIMK
jgi:hypothetical protein